MEVCCICGTLVGSPEGLWLIIGFVLGIWLYYCCTIKGFRHGLGNTLIIRCINVDIIYTGAFLYHKVNVIFVIELWQPIYGL